MKQHHPLLSALLMCIFLMMAGCASTGSTPANSTDSASESSNEPAAAPPADPECD